MSIKTQTTAMALCLAILSMQFISCKKENVESEILSTSSTDSAVVAKANLIAWYKFTNGNTADFSGHNNHLTANDVTLATDYKGRPNNAYAFNGYSSFMQAQNSSSLNPSSKITLVALFKPTGFYSGTGATSRILMKGTDDQSNGDYFLGYFNTGSIYGTYGDNQYQCNGVVGPENSIQLNKWYKVVYTYNDSIGKLYVNGTLINQTGKKAVFTPNTTPLMIGKTGRDDYPYFFKGVIDEIRIYNTGLNAIQVATITKQIGQ